MMAAPPFPSDEDVYTIADWAEITAVSTGRSVSRGKLITTLAREGAVSSAMAQDVWSELERRSALLAETWPLVLEDAVLRARTARPSIIYVFLAALGLRYNIDGRGRELFEHCVTQIVAALTGRPGIRIGFPRRSPVPTPLAEAVNEYCRLSDEQLGRIAPPSSDGDLGLDIVSWRSFADGRGGYVHYIGQCATGADWRDKLTELNPHKWTDHVNWAVPAVRFFATPFVLRHEEFRRVSMDGGLILDRPRLLSLEKEAKLSRKLTNTLRAYCEELYR